MPELKTLSANDVIKIFMHFSFEIKSQKGSHIKMHKNNIIPRQILTIPNHKEISRGTLKAIYKQAIRYIPENELFPFFYNQ